MCRGCGFLLTQLRGSQLHSFMIKNLSKREIPSSGCVKWLCGKKMTNYEREFELEAASMLYHVPPRKVFRGDQRLESIDTADQGN